MTAEIAILNRAAVAMAADSTVTIGGSKTYNSVNKLFAMSKYEPVGIMVYGAATLMGVPWETVIKLFRSEFGEKGFPTLDEYAREFVGFLQRRKDLFPEEQQTRTVKQRAFNNFSSIKDKIDKEVLRLTKEGAQVSIEDLKRIGDEKVHAFNAGWERCPFLEGRNAESITAFASEYGSSIDEVQAHIFEGLPFSEETLPVFREIVANYFVRDIFVVEISGIVIAGFGQDEYFPHLRSYLIEGVVGGQLKYKLDQDADVSFDMGSSIIPFAQTEMVQTFCRGIDPGLSVKVNGVFDSLADSVREIALETVKKHLPSGLDDTKWQEVCRDVAEQQAELLDSTKDEVRKHSWENYINPVIDAVSNLPQAELAEMAEALVNLTSFKRRVSMDVESVGGPVDVAVITKGDGFVWVKRKHYFQAEMNHGFLRNYFRR